MKRISQTVLAHLSNLRFDGNNATIADQLDRKTYVSVNEALEAAGGKWDRKAKAHIFPMSAKEAIDDLIDNGGWTDAKKELQFFETPPELAARVIDEARIIPGMRVLEPSAGAGALIKELPADVTVYAWDLYAIKEYIGGRCIYADLSDVLECKDRTAYFDFADFLPSPVPESPESAQAPRY
jgi:hypothetical protein